MCFNFKYPFLFGLIFLVCIGICGCGGSSAPIAPIVGSIEGPGTLLENSSAVYSVDIDCPEATYQWTCDPASAGVIESPASDSTKFTAGEVGSDTLVELMVIVETGA